MDTPFLPAEEDMYLCQTVYVDVDQENSTCSCCSPDSVDVDLRKAWGVVVNDNLDSWDIQTPVVQQ